MTQGSLFPPTHAQPVKPVLKWAGGKRNLLPQFKRYFPRPDSYRTYFEPFLGGGAVFFYLRPRQSFLFDTNEELIETYQVIRDSPDDLICELKKYRNDRELFYNTRSLIPATLTRVQRAARFIFLNKTCYNGLYRVNSQGQFNVPFGKYKNPVICDVKAIHAASLALQGSILRTADFEAVLQDAREGDFIYFDPPYVPLNGTSSFTNYTSEGFNVEEQFRLARTFRVLHERGCLLMLSNSSHPIVYEMYEHPDFHIHEISAKRVINSKPDKRGEIKELLVTNFGTRSN